MNVRNACVALVLAASQAAALRPGGHPWLTFGEIPVTPGDESENTPPITSTNSKIKAYNLSVPIDHFHNETKYEPHSGGFYNLRYWLDTSYYKEGGPVIILHSGEFDSDGRLPYLEHGIVPVLTKATGGVGIVLEHRYYGTSWPTNETTPASYRFLTTDQALADTAYFSKTIKIPGLEHLNLTAPGTPHILYGGSYAGGFVALARKLYPDVFWGAISSSGVTAAIDDFWQYFEAARHFSPGDCSPTLQNLTDIVDKQLLSGDKKKENGIKSLFGLQDLWNDEFASVLVSGLLALQSTNWDPEEDTTAFGTFCAVISSDSVLFSSTSHLQHRVRSAVQAAGYGAEPLTSRMLNYIGFIRDFVKKEKKQGSCKGKKNLRECLSPRLQKNDERHNWQRSWTWQTCTEWGYFLSGESTPKDRLPMVSRALTAEFSSYDCKASFNITTRPDVDIINKHGGFNFSYPRLALIDGKQDPWRCAGSHAIGLPGRESTTSEPFELIDWGVHHWDEFGLSDDAEREPGLPPKQVVDIQQKEVQIVKDWLKEFEGGKGVHEDVEL
ncbi:hypothetical protein QQS21_008856 [Conoideocrella luteorostrata]|uniref:Extracelular serine carboxypeptidase n=1 Tax=Conoideocrella luteorostrata TaxID=1105319 RepID=A0AAJ0CI74_9HYPO|nr:hypothetical protein QQS21_008856 [Conoideocrella luteorostrata]